MGRTGNSCPRRDVIEVIRMPLKPQGTIRSKALRSVLTFKANPCLLTQRLTCTPMEAILASPIQTPVCPARRSP